jgi:hypothetical protein
VIRKNRLEYYFTKKTVTHQITIVIDRLQVTFKKYWKISVEEKQKKAKIELSENSLDLGMKVSFSFIFNILK